MKLFKKTEKAITLLDALVSLVILSLGFLMILTVIPGTGIFIKSSENRLLAKQIAQTYLEFYSSSQHWPEVSTAGFTATNTETVTTTVNGKISSSSYTWTVTSTPYPGVQTGQLYNLNVRVTWNEHTMGRGSASKGGRLRQIELLTIVVNPD